MRFTTASGAVYDIFGAEGDQYITRDCEIPVIDWGSRAPVDFEIVATPVSFERLPTIGERFEYTTPNGPILSTTVVSIDG